MGRIARIFSTKLIILPILLVMVAGFGVGLWVHETNASHVQTVTNARHQITQISYRGEAGVNALALLKTHAQVATKHYSFGDFVTSIDGVKGNGPKYWTFYVNHKESNTGAGAYITKTSDTLTWKLQ